jgi:predicted transcriptional regulator
MHYDIHHEYIRLQMDILFGGAEMKTTTIRMQDKTLKRIDAMAKSFSRSRTWVINQALERYISHEEWFAHEVKSGLDEMQNGDLASPEEVSNKLQKWDINAD